MRLLKFAQKVYNKITRRGKDDFAHLPCESAKGNVLLSYIKSSVLVEDDDPALDFHTNLWECREIARIFNKLGYNVDSIDWNNSNFAIRKKYAVFMDIHANLFRFNLPKPCAKLMHITGSYPQYSNSKEKVRVRSLLARRNFFVSPKKQTNEKTFEKSIKIADKGTLIGNQHTLATFPVEYQNKLTCVTPTPSRLLFIKQDEDYLPKDREFLWLSGTGAVHKGLDLLLEIFVKHPEWTLNLVGPINDEKDFCELYHKALFETENIKNHGYLKPSSDEFGAICRRCFSFLYPTCAEGTSTSALTALSVGLYPIISEDTGLDLPDNCGIWLKDCTIEEIESSIAKVMQLNEEELCAQIYAVHKFVLTKFSRENFTKQMTEFLAEVCEGH